MYHIIGADQKEYGPVTQEQLRQWIAEGRADANTMVRSEGGEWKRLSTHEDFADAFPAQSAGGALPPPVSSPPPPYYPEQRKTNGTATAGFVLSLLGFLCCGPLLGVPGLILSIVALTQINKNPQTEGGKGLAIAGIVIGVISIIAFVVLLFSGAWAELLRELN